MWLHSEWPRRAKERERGRGTESGEERKAEGRGGERVGEEGGGGEGRRGEKGGETRGERRRGKRRGREERRGEARQGEERPKEDTGACEGAQGVFKILWGGCPPWRLPSRCWTMQKMFVFIKAFKGCSSPHESRSQGERGGDQQKANNLRTNMSKAILDYKAQAYQSNSNRKKHAKNKKTPVHGAFPGEMKKGIYLSKVKQ